MDTVKISDVNESVVDSKYFKEDEKKEEPIDETSINQTLSIDIYNMTTQANKRRSRKDRSTSSVKSANKRQVTKPPTLKSDDKLVSPHEIKETSPNQKKDIKNLNQIEDRLDNSLELAKKIQKKLSQNRNVLVSQQEDELKEAFSNLNKMNNNNVTNNQPVQDINQLKEKELAEKKKIVQIIKDQKE